MYTGLRVTDAILNYPDLSLVLRNVNKTLQKLQATMTTTNVNRDEIEKRKANQSEES